jgi:superfamily II DNA/RNA helicase
MGVTALHLSGETAVRDSVRALEKGVQVVLGGPGHIVEFMRRRYLQPSHFRLLVIDEADEILSMGYEPAIRELFTLLPANIQVVILSAVFSPEVLQITAEFMRDPVKVLVKYEDKTLEGIKQYYVPIAREDGKFDVLCDLLEHFDAAQLVIYVNRTFKSKELGASMTERGLKVAVMNSEMEVTLIDSVRTSFSTGEVRYLIKTDLCSESTQDHLVIQYDLPVILETYVQRIGRTGCFGRRGVSIAFVTQAEVNQLKAIQTCYSTVVEELPADLAAVL